jgi:hypothetical protein
VGQGPPVGRLPPVEVPVRPLSGLALPWGVRRASERTVGHHVPRPVVARITTRPCDVRVQKVCESCGREYVATGSKAGIRRLCVPGCRKRMAARARARERETARARKVASGPQVVGLCKLTKGHSVLYRHFAPDGTLLYVGISEHFWSRLRSHRAQSPWWGAVAWVTVTAGTSRAQVLRAEAVAIYLERPLWNRDPCSPARALHPVGWVRWTSGRWAREYARRAFWP